MQKVIFTAAAAAAVFGLASSASATRWLVIGSGQTNAGMALAGQPFLPDVPLGLQTVNFGFEVDDSVAGTPIPGPFGIGEGALFQGAIENFTMYVGPYAIVARPDSPRNILAYDNAPGGVPPTERRVDQFTYNAGVDFSQGFAPHLLLDPTVGPDLSVTNLLFGRSEMGTDIAPPTMLVGTAFPFLPDVWRPGVPMAFLFDVRQGTASNGAELRALPVVRFNASVLTLGVFALPDAGVVPEPASWAMLIAGFGLVGGRLRRQRALCA